MKKFTILAVVLVLTATLFAGCRGSRSDPSETPSTGGSTMPTLDMTMPDILPDMTTGTDNTDGMDSTGGMDGTDGTGASGDTGSTESTTNITAPSARSGFMN